METTDNTQEQSAQDTTTPAAATTQQQESSTPQEPSTLAELDAISESLLNPAPEDKTPKTEDAKPPEDDASQQQQHQDEDRVPDRVRITALHDDDKKLVATAINMVRDGHARTIPEAIAKLSTPAEQDATTEQQPVKDAAPTEPEKNPYDEAINSKLDILKQIKAALVDPETEFDEKKKADLYEQLADVKADLKLIAYAKEQHDAALARQQETEAVTYYQTTYQAAREEANTLFPEAADPESELYAAIRRDVAEKERTNPEFFQDPRYPVILAATNAARLGRAPSTFKAAQATKAPAASPSAPRQVAARPIQPVVGADATAGQSDPASARRQVESIRSLHDLDALATAAFSGR